MKKVYLLAFVFILSIMFYNKINDKTELVFNEQEYINNYDNEYFYVTSKSINLNTNNLIEYFGDYDIQIMGIYPNLDKIYDENIKTKLRYFSFNGIYDNKVNLNNFTNKYVGLLKNNNYIEQANLVYFDGINIDKVLIYAPYNSIYLHDVNYNSFSYTVKEF